jgi:formylglycine-generating enzyme required for sulfatase activity
MNTLDALLAGIVADPLDETRGLVPAGWYTNRSHDGRMDMDPLRTRAFGVALLVTVLALGVVAPTPTRSAPVPKGNEKDEPFEYDVAGVTKKGTRTVRTVALGGKATMRFVRVKAGTFRMGSPKDEKGRDEDETQHEVTITTDFYLGLSTVTRGQFRAFVDDTKHQTDAEADGKGGYGWDAAAKDWKQDPKYTWRSVGFDQTDEHPVVNVSWNDAIAFCEWLSKKVGATFRLPSEAEWEFACRAGTTTRFSFGDDEEDLWKYANVADKEFRAATGKDWGINGSDGYGFTAPVGQFRANGWGLHDMHGNVWQWCADYYGPYDKVDGSKDPLQSTKHTDNSSRVVRGGSWNISPLYCRAACRYWYAPAYRGSNCGFRVCFRLD